VDLLHFKMTALAAIGTALSVGALRGGVVVNLKWVGGWGLMLHDLVLGWGQNLDGLDLGFAQLLG
jgi:hypothetical protein